MLRRRFRELKLLTTCALTSACADAPAEPAAAASTEAQVASAEPAERPALRPAKEVSGASNTPLAYDDPDLRCYRLTAYGAPDAKDQPYSVPTTKDLYTSFTIKAPWEGTQYVKSVRSVLDNLAVLHHWMLIRQHNDGPEKVTPNASGIHGDGDMIYAWAPGASDLYFGEDVGMEIPGGSLLMIENHYNNRTGSPVPDASGAEVCVTPKKPKHLAGLSYVGTDMINGTSASGSCTHDSKEPVHLIMSFPHMHVKGVHMKVDLTRTDGTTEVVHDSPFDFNYQRAYTYEDLVLQPGDKLTTHCTYDSPARMGKGTDEEMCFFFSLHYPVGALSKKNFFQALHGPNTCID